MQAAFSNECSRLIRYEISEANGNEVFFLAEIDDDGLITEATAIARGNRRAVPAILNRATAGQLVLHNHPSGHLEPSDADLDIASVCGNNGIGFGIIDNSCKRCYMVVQPHRQQQLEPIDPEEIRKLFSAGGMLSKKVKGYELRNEQLQMALEVANAINRNQVALIEAGTGTGKSLAYLIPSLLWAIRNDQRVVISTNTINLQEQLIKKDIPLLRQHVGKEFNACLVKGRGNYLCLRKLGDLLDEPSLFPDSSAAEINAIANWGENSRSGCLSDLSFTPTRAVWDDIRCEADQCGRSRCSHFNRCFFYKARREAASARLLVANHALLLADIALRRESGYDSVAILPPFSQLVIDEAHHLEDAATNALSVQISRAGLLKQLARLVSTGNRAGILNLLNNKIGRELPQEFDDLYQEISGLIESLLLPTIKEVAGELDQQFDWLTQSISMEMLLNDNRHERELKRRITPAVRDTPFWYRLENSFRQLAARVQGVADGLAALDRSVSKLPDSVSQVVNGLLTDAFGIGQRLASISTELSLFCTDDQVNCRWIESRQGMRGWQAAICMAPLDLSETIKSSLFEKIDTVILTSATLTVGESFSYLRRRTGLDLLEQNRLTELILPSPFNYAEQAMVAIPPDLPDPGSGSFLQPLAEAVLKAVTLSKGGAFVLFTSFDLLRRTAEQLRGELEQRNITVLRQGEGANRHQLLARFRKERNAVLFGTDSFWEGVDVQGDALRLVVISKLPFQVPTEPVQQARAEQIAADGGDPFRDMSIPQAVLKLRQGFGRLIRSRTDRGAVLILDSRMVTKSYGKRFRKSLPQEAQLVAPLSELLQELGRFFKGVS